VAGSVAVSWRARVAAALARAVYSRTLGALRRPIMSLPATDWKAFSAHRGPPPEAAKRRYNCRVVAVLKRDLEKTQAKVKVACAQDPPRRRYKALFGKKPL